MSAVHRKKNDPAFQLLNGQAGMDVNDRCEVAKILRTQPKTIVFVFAGGRQTRDKEFVRDMLHQCHTEGSEKKKKKSGGCLFFLRPTADFWNSTYEGKKLRSEHCLCFTSARRWWKVDKKEGFLSKYWIFVFILWQMFHPSMSRVWLRYKACVQYISGGWLVLSCCRTLTGVTGS